MTKNEIVKATRDALKLVYMRPYIEKYGNKNKLLYDFMQYALDKNYSFSSVHEWASLIKVYVEEFNKIRSLECGDDKVFSYCYSEVKDVCKKYEVDILRRVCSDYRFDYFKWLAIKHLIDDCGFSVRGACSKYLDDYDYICVIAHDIKKTIPNAD